MQQSPPTRRRSRLQRQFAESGLNSQEEQEQRLREQEPETPLRSEQPFRQYRQEEAPKEKHTRPRGFRRALLLLVALAAVAAVMLLVFPWEPQNRAAFTVATQDGKVETVTSQDHAYYEGLLISEIMASNRTAVPDDTGSYSDWLELWNASGHAIDLEHVGLSDKSDTIRFVFPAVTLQPDERVVVYASNSNQSEPGRAFHAKFKLSSIGETAYLYDPSGYLIQSVRYPIMGTDESYALLEDGKYGATAVFTPGYPNTQAGYEAYRTDNMSLSGALVINEVMADPVTGLRDEDGELCDWVELYNSTDRTIDLTTYALSDKENRPLKWIFPEGASIAPHGYYVVFCSGKDRVDSATGVPHTNFRLSAERETIILSDTRGQLVDRVIFDNLPEDCSWARQPDGSYQVDQTATPGMPNDQSGHTQADYMLQALNPTGVVISEVMASNDSTAVYEGDGFVDWIEIHNTTQQTVDLSGWGLSDRLTRGRKWQFPAGTTIGPGDYKVILCDGTNNVTNVGQLHTNYRILRAGGEIVTLTDPEGRVLDKLILPRVPTNVSYGRTVGRAGFFYYDTPTPFAANGEGFAGYAPTPAFTLAPGLYEGAVRTSFTIPEGTSVFYTTDGSVPTRASSPYNGETLELNFTTVFRVRAFSDAGLKESEVLTGTYFINAYHSLPIVSLVVDPEELWNPITGMLAPGDRIDKSDGIPFKNAVYRENKAIHREGHVEYYLLDGTQVLDQGLDVSLQGQYSLDMPQKSFKLRAKSLYGAKTFDAALFADRPYTQYKSFVLRNSGNDCAWTRLLDGFQSRLLDSYGSQVIHQAWNPVAVYLNGVYWGHYNMRERVDRFFVAQHEGLELSEASQMDILEANSKLVYGSGKEYKDMIKKLKGKSFDPVNNPEDLQYILDNVDVDNYFEYIALEMYFGNSDPGNIRYYRLRKPGAKWRWIFYDADYGLFNSGFDSPASYLRAKGMGQQKIDNTILLKLLSVPEYKDRFLRKLGEIFQTFTTDYMSEILEPMVAQIAPEMPLHFARWGEESDKAILAEWPNTVDGAYRYWQQRIDRLRNTIKKRPNLFWGFAQEAFGLSNEEMQEYFGPRPAIPDDAV